MKHKGLIKLSTFARLCGVSTQAVYIWIAEGKVKPIEIDGVKFFEQDTKRPEKK